MMDENGENQVALTQSLAEEWGPTWVNEEEITFLRQNDDSIDRILLNLKTNAETVIQHPNNCLLDDKNVLYSPNGLQLYSCKDDIFIFHPGEKLTINITENLNGSALYPSFSHDGKSVVFTSNHLGNNQIFSYQIDTKETVQLTSTIANNERGELSPDNHFLLYSTDYFEKGNQDIVIQDLESGNIENISNSHGMELIARFSGNGDIIYFGSNKEGNWEIYSFNRSTKVVSQLTNTPEFDGDPRILKR